MEHLRCDKEHNEILTLNEAVIPVKGNSQSLLPGSPSWPRTINRVDDSSERWQCFLSVGISEENFQRAHSFSILLLNFCKVSSAPGEVASYSIKNEDTMIKSSKIYNAHSWANHIIYFLH